MIRPTGPADWPALQALYPAAFPDEDLLALVQALLADPTVLSLVAVQDGAVIGHIAFTPCGVGDTPVSLLGPLAVAPPAQRQGNGSALIQAGLDRLRATDTRAVVLLGDPAYYGRFGFRQETGITTPYPLPSHWGPAWQSLPLAPDRTIPAGALAVPSPWQVPSCWGA